MLHTYETMEAINCNIFYRDLIEKIKKNYNMYGEFIYSFFSKKRYNDGMYLLVSFSKERVDMYRKRIEELEEESRYDTDYRYDVGIFRITDCCPMDVHFHVLNYCLHASTLRGILNIYKFPYQLTKVNTDFIKLVEAYYKRSVDYDLPLEEREFCKKFLEMFIAVSGTEQFFRKRENSFDKSYYNYREVKPIPLVSPINHVTLKNLLRPGEVLGIKKIFISEVDLKKFLKELKKRPEIKFSYSKPFKLEYKGEKKLPEYLHSDHISTVQFLFDSRYSMDISIMLLKIESPELFKTTVQDAERASPTRNAKGTYTIGLNSRDIHLFFSEAEKTYVEVNYGLEKVTKPLSEVIAIDTDFYYWSPHQEYYTERYTSGVTVVIPIQFKDEVERMAYRLSNKIMKVKFLSWADEVGFNKERDRLKERSEVFYEEDKKLTSKEVKEKLYYWKYKIEDFFSNSFKKIMETIHKYFK